MTGAAGTVWKGVKRRALGVYAVLAVAYLMLPIAVVVLFSFNDPAGRFNYVWQEFTFDNWINWDDVLGIRDALVTSLTGRWSTFTPHLGRLWRVPVEHPPWPLHRARLDRLSTSMLADAGLPSPEGEPLVHWSPGVDARVGAPRRAAR